MEEEDAIIPEQVDSWEETRTTKSEHQPVPLASFRTRVRTLTEETTLAQYSKRLISRTLSGIKASGQSLSKIIVLPAEKQQQNTTTEIPYTMTEDNPFVLMEDEHDLASSTALSSVSSISLDSARRLAPVVFVSPDHPPAAEEQSRPPPAEIRIRIPSSLDSTECEDWQAAWVKGGTPTSDTIMESVSSSLPRTSSPHRRPPMATRSRTMIERPKPISNGSIGTAPSPSLSRVHTDTTSVTTGTLRRTTTAGTTNEPLLVGRPKRAVTTGATVFSFGSRVGESSVSSPVKTVVSKSNKPPSPWKNLTAPVKRWTASPAKLCRSSTGCMA